MSSFFNSRAEHVWVARYDEGYVVGGELQRPRSASVLKHLGAPSHAGGRRAPRAPVEVADDEEGAAGRCPWPRVVVVVVVAVSSSSSPHTGPPGGLRSPPSCYRETRVAVVEARSTRTARGPSLHPVACTMSARLRPPPMLPLLSRAGGRCLSPSIDSSLLFQ